MSISIPVKWLDSTNMSYWESDKKYLKLFLSISYVCYYCICYDSPYFINSALNFLSPVQVTILKTFLLKCCLASSHDFSDLNMIVVTWTWT